MKIIDTFQLNKLIIFPIIVVLTLLISGCIGEKLEVSDNGSKKAIAPIHINLSLSGTPSLGENITINFKVKPEIYAPNTTIIIELPEGFEYIDGNLSWNGDIQQNETVQISAKLKTVVEGEWKIKAWAHSSQPDGSFGKGDILYITVGKYFGIIGTNPFPENFDEDEIKTTIPLNGGK